MKRTLFLALLLAVPCFCSGQVPTADEKPLWELWQFHLDNVSNHVEVAAKCAEFAKVGQNYQFAVIADGLGAWHLLEAGQQTNAVKILTKLAQLQPTSPLATAAANMGKSWLTRIDRDKIRWALKLYYRQQVEFPETLDVLQTMPPDIRPPAKDRFERNWVYRIVNFKALKGFKNQKYELLSSTLDKKSDFTEALKEPYGASIQMKPIKIMSGSPGRETISFENTAPKKEGDKKETVYVAVGSSNGNIMFAHSGQKLIVLSDGSHWAIMLKPK